MCPTLLEAERKRNNDDKVKKDMTCVTLSFNVQKGLNFTIGEN